MLSTDCLISAAIVLGAAGIFALDVSSLYGVGGGAAYTLIIVLASYRSRRIVIAAAILSAVFTTVGALVGAKAGLMLPSLISSRICGLVVIFVVTGVVLHQLKLRAAATILDQDVAHQNKALLEMTRVALFTNTPLKQCFECITERTCLALKADAVAVGQLADDSANLTFVDIWDRRLGNHFVDIGMAVSSSPELWQYAVAGTPIIADDVTTSELHRPALAYFDQRGIRALLHLPALYRERSIASLGVGHGQPHHWAEHEIAFAKSVTNIVALLFAVHQCEQTLERLDCVSEGIFVENNKGKIEYANRAARALVGGDAVPLALDPLAADRDEHHLSHNGHDLEVHRRRLPDGGVLIRVDDVTERNAAQAETERMRERLEQSSKLHAMGQLAAGVAHDFNNILSAIMGFVQILAKVLESRPAEQVFAERILGVCKKGKGITDEILQFARTSSVERTDIDLAQVLEGSLDLIPDGPPGAPKLEVDLPRECLPISGNSAQLMQLIQNLVINARHACAGVEGHITLTAGRASRLEVRSLSRASGSHGERFIGKPDITKDYCFLRVSDNGHGIPPEIMDRIFEPFFTTKGQRQGSGLGLAVVHAVVNAHEGCCHVQSEPGRGTTFTIYAPMLADMIGRTPAPDIIDLSAIRGTERVLIIDDNVELSEILEVGLQQLGYSTAALSDPHEALAMIRDDPAAFDVLVTDQVMPKMEGVDLVAAVKTHHSGIKVVLCTGANLPGMEEKALAAGADAFLRKPLDASHIAFTIRTLLRQSQQAA